jgi:hypothetical protein
MNKVPPVLFHFDPTGHTLAFFDGQHALSDVTEVTISPNSFSFRRAGGEVVEGVFDRHVARSAAGKAPDDIASFFARPDGQAPAPGTAAANSADVNKVERDVAAFIGGLSQ